jgi:hypothetical protein
MAERGRAATLRGMDATPKDALAYTCEHMKETETDGRSPTDTESIRRRIFTEFQVHKTRSDTGIQDTRYSDYVSVGDGVTSSG